jgi:hypothetical protein
LSYAAEGLQRTLLVADSRFLVERVSVEGGEAHLETDRLPLTITMMDAHLRIDAGDDSVVLEPWLSILTPAAYERVTLIPSGEPTRALVVHPQPDLERARHRALAAGAQHAAVDAFFAQFE